MRREESFPNMFIMNTMLDRTLCLLAQTSIPPRTISRETGLGYDWLIRLRRGEIRDPGIRKIESLHDYLSEAS